MERITQEADFGLEDWEETLFFVKSDPNGAYDILDIAKHQGEPEFDEILKTYLCALPASKTSWATITILTVSASLCRLIKREESESCPLEKTAVYLEHYYRGGEGDA